MQSKIKTPVNELIRNQSFLFSILKFVSSFRASSDRSCIQRFCKNEFESFLSSYLVEFYFIEKVTSTLQYFHLS